MAQNWHTEVTDADRERQIRFELECIEEGARKAREAVMSQGLSDSTVGMKMMRNVVKPLVKEIETAQAEAAKNLIDTTRQGRAVTWWWPILTIDKHKLSVIILNAVFQTPPRDGSVNYPISRVALNIHHSLYTQIDYDLWVEEQKSEKKQTGDRTDLDRFLNSTKNVDHKTFKRFSDRLKRKRLEKWTYDVGIQIGVKCIDMLTHAKPEWFYVDTNPVKNGRFETQLCFTDQARDVIYDLIEKEEVMSPQLLPTLIPPADWRKKEGQNDRAA